MPFQEPHPEQGNAVHDIDYKRTQLAVPYHKALAGIEIRLRTVREHRPTNREFLQAELRSNGGMEAQKSVVAGIYDELEALTIPVGPWTSRSTVATRYAFTEPVIIGDSPGPDALAG